jgi:hypothetical protein
VEKTIFDRWSLSREWPSAFGATTPPSRSRPALNLELFDRRLAIHDAAMRLIAYVVAKDTSAQEGAGSVLRRYEGCSFLV